MDLNEISLAKLSLHKLILNEVNKIKATEKEWKTILIQYKSRIEKKRSWKEKQKFHKEIEENLTRIQNEEATKEKLIEKENIELNVNSELVNNIDEDIESLNDEDDDEEVTDEEEEEEDDESNEENEIEKKLIEESMIKYSKKRTNDDRHLKQIEPKKPKNEILSEYFNPDFKSNYKPRINTTSKVMVIKQIALDELSGDDDEIKLENTKDAEEDNSEKTDLIKHTTLDPFFLPSNGTIQTVDTSNARVDNSIRDHFDDYDDDGRSKRFKNSRYLDSTFTNLPPSREYNRNSSSYPSNQNRFERDDNNSYRKRDNWQNNRTTESNGYQKSEYNNSYHTKERYQEKPKPKPVEDEANLHPSWKAKREQEEKLKNLKFQGVKVKFDDD